MKKIIALLLVLVMAVSMVACSNTDNNETTAPNNETTAPVAMPESALEILNTVWAAVPEDNKFMIAGGDGGMGAPGAADITNTDFLTYTMLVPAEQVANVTEVATMQFMMNANSFTCGAYRVTGDAQAFAKAMRDAVQGNVWMCGFPEKVLIHVMGEYVVVAFGLAGISDPMGDFMGAYTTAMNAAYPNAAVAYDEAIAG